MNNLLFKYFYYRNKNTLLLKGDVKEILPLFPYNFFDLVVTDPPYESLKRWEGIGTTGRMGLGKKGTNADNPNKLYETITNQELKQCLGLFYLLLKDRTHCYTICDIYTLPIIYSYMENSQWTNLKPLIWNKQKIGMGYHYRCQYEFVLMFDKSKNRKLNNLGISDILSFLLTEKKEYPTQKPVELFELLINQSSNENGLILDPFLGSGSSAIAAIKSNRQFIGIDIDKRALDLTIKRIENINKKQDSDTEETNLIDILTHALKETKK